MSVSVILFSTLIVGDGVRLDMKIYDSFYHFNVLPKIYVTDCLKKEKSNLRGFPSADMFDTPKKLQQPHVKRLDPC